jgi:signal transduction histidine kinase
MSMHVVTVVKRNPYVFPLVIAAAVTMVVISEMAHWQSMRTLDDLGRISAARSSVQALQQGILAAEAGQRGYLLTARKEQLAPYDKALAEIEGALVQLHSYHAADTEAGTVLARLHELTRVKLAGLAAAIRLFDEGKGAASTDIVLSDLNRRRMDAIRALGAELLMTQAVEADTGREDLHRTLLQRRVGMALLTAISLVALLLYLRQAHVLRRQEQQLQDVGQAERERLEIEVALRTTELTQLTHHLQTAREDERQRLARNLHDELGALLTSAKLDAARIRSRLAGTAPEALERLAHLVETLNASIALGRSIIEDLRPSTLANLGLVATLEILAREFGERSNVEVECALAPVVLDAAAELTVYRLVQEAITNISKHARARRVWLSMATHGGRVEVTVRDDGSGFDASVPPRSAYGLVGMRFRVEAAGGTLAVHSAPGQGTRLMLSLPESVREVAARAV